MIETRAALERIVEWTAPGARGARARVALPAENGAQRARRALEDGAPLADVYREARRRDPPHLRARARRRLDSRPWRRASSPPAEQPAGGDAEPTAPDQEELQRRLEEQLRRIRVQDLLLESVASILNLAARRISKAGRADLEQGRVGIEAVRAVLDLLDEGPREQVREALSQVQMLYAREARAAANRLRRRGGASARASVGTLDAAGGLARHVARRNAISAGRVILLGASLLFAALVVAAARPQSAYACEDEGPCDSAVTTVLCPFPGSSGTGSAEFDIPKDARDVTFKIVDADTGQEYPEGSSICSGHDDRQHEPHRERARRRFHRQLHDHQLGRRGSRRAASGQGGRDVEAQTDFGVTKELAHPAPDEIGTDTEITFLVTVSNYGPAPAAASSFVADYVFKDGVAGRANGCRFVRHRQIEGPPASDGFSIGVRTARRSTRSSASSPWGSRS